MYDSKGLSKHLANFLPRSRNAAFTAAISFYNLARRPCTDGTRVYIIAQIMSWVNERKPRLYIGSLGWPVKTTIAYTICKLLEDASQPFVSFCLFVPARQQESEASCDYSMPRPYGAP